MKLFKKKKLLGPFRSTPGCSIGYARGFFRELFTLCLRNPYGDRKAERSNKHHRAPRWIALLRDCVWQSCPLSVGRRWSILRIICWSFNYSMFQWGRGTRAMQEARLGCMKKKSSPERVPHKMQAFILVLREIRTTEEPLGFLGGKNAWKFLWWKRNRVGHLLKKACKSLGLILKRSSPSSHERDYPSTYTVSHPSTHNTSAHTNAHIKSWQSQRRILKAENTNKPLNLCWDRCQTVYC